MKNNAKTNSYIRIVPDAKTAILFIHGIVGSPTQFEYLLQVVPHNISIHNMLLDGHGKTVKDFSNTSMLKWEKQVENAIKELKSTHQNLIVVAHSMGGLLSICEAIKEPQSICQLFLLATPLNISVKPLFIKNTLKVAFNKIKADDYIALAYKDGYSIDIDLRFWRYLGWIPRYIELFKKAKFTRNNLTKLQTNTVIFQSQKDEMVSNKSIKYIKNNSKIKLHILKNSNHSYYDEFDKQLLIEKFEETIKRYK